MIKVKANGEHLVVAQFTPSEARLVSEALARAARPHSLRETKLGPLRQWYEDLGKSLLIQANEAAECKVEDNCNHDSLATY